MGGRLCGWSFSYPHLQTWPNNTSGTSRSAENPGILDEATTVDRKRSGFGKMCAFPNGMATKKGKGVLGSVQEIPGDIHITNGNQETVNIKRIQAWEAERILDVRCALNGQDEVEFKYRLAETTTLVGRIVSAPLTRNDAEIVCIERWMVSIKYCLSITRLSPDQCHQLSIPTEKALLLKLGFNRHMPKVVLYGPKNTGGNNS